MQLRQTPLGYEIRTPNTVILLGGRQAQLPQIREAYPEFQFLRVKQTHSDHVVESTDVTLDYQIEADAHFTEKESFGLCVVTADCVPVFFYDQETSLIAGVHAGWRGVASRIIPKTIAKLKERGVNPSHLNVVVGPHIQKNSFEVGLDVRDQILASLWDLPDSEKEIYFESLSDSKVLVDLNAVVKSQLQNEGIEFDRLFNLYIDTVSNPGFHSHRRDKEKAGRQISFIARIP